MIGVPLPIGFPPNDPIGELISVVTGTAAHFNNNYQAYNLFNNTINRLVKLYSNSGINVIVLE